MLELQELFVPVDFSRSSRASVRVARALAERVEARLGFVHAMPQVPRYAEQTLFPFAAMGEDRMQLLAELKDNAYKALARYHELGELASEAERKAGASKGNWLDVVPAEEDEAVERTLARRLGESNAQLVVIGVSGEVMAGALGSTALRLLCESTRPVLVARDIPPDPIDKVAVALDLSPHSARVLQEAVELALLTGAALEVIVAIPEPLAIDVRGILQGVVRSDVKALDKHARREVGKLLERFAGDLKIPFPFKERFDALAVERSVLLGDPVEQIVGRAAEGGAQVLVIGTHGERRATLSRRLGRVAHVVGANAPCHVLYVP